MGESLGAVFRRSLGSLLSPGQPRILVACSRGTDSLALLSLADDWAKDHKAFLAVAHVDHGLRGAASRADARYVMTQARRLGRPGAVRRVPVQSWARAHKRGLEDAARHLRYQALAELSHHFRCPDVLTAHTLNDQAETVWMHLLRGAGPSGLGAMAPVSAWPVPFRRKAPRLLRPLLNVRRARLEEVVRGHALHPREDSSNRDTRFLRNRLRPDLARWENQWPGLMERLARLARVAHDEDRFWKEKIGLDRRKKRPNRLERAAFLRYHCAEQRRRLRHLFNLADFESVERVRLFAADKALGPLDIPQGRVLKTRRHLIFRWKKGTKSSLPRFIREQ